VAPQRIALEIEGLTHDGGRHQRVQGYTNDLRKYNEAALLGWVLIRVTQKMLKKGEAFTAVERAFKALKAKEGACSRSCNHHDKNNNASSTRTSSPA
jgi:hypothetical protein